MRRILPLLAFALIALGAAWHDGLAQPKRGRPPLGIEKVAADLFVIIGSGGNIRQGKSQEEVRAFLATQYPASYTSPNSLNNQWSLPGFMTELK
ncbi:MAG: hypothetical protein HY736_09785 [Verrucomicrobia bacterium]|nr:hypothetical protein [Verrucomicrobiota bacterium]